MHLGTCLLPRRLYNHIYAITAKILTPCVVEVRRLLSRETGSGGLSLEWTSLHISRS